MSRSRRKTPVTGIATSISEKDDKRMAAGRARAQSRQALLAAPGEVLAPVRHQSGNPWAFGKDGKRYWRAEDLRRIALHQGPRGIRKLLGK